MGTMNDAGGAGKCRTVFPAPDPSDGAEIRPMPECRTILSPYGEMSLFAKPSGIPALARNPSSGAGLGAGIRFRHSPAHERSPSMMSLDPEAHKAMERRIRQVLHERGPMSRDDLFKAVMQLEDEELLAEAWDRSNGFCFYCGIQMNPFSNFEIDALSTIDGPIPACTFCVATRGDRSLEAFRDLYAADHRFFFEREL
jgi:hypothetical protein